MTASIPSAQEEKTAGQRPISHEEALRHYWVQASADDLLAALQGLVGIINAAGVYQLSRGVELGGVSWSVKCSDRMAVAEAAIAKATGASS